MSDIVIRAENLGKKYRIQHQHERQRYVALRDVCADKLFVLGRWLRVPSAKSNVQAASPSTLGSLPKTEDF